jgi:chromosome segregation ATPase
MPGKQPPPKDPQPPPGPGWQIILEEILSQNRATIEAVQSSRDELKRDIAELRENTDVRFQVLESAVRQNGADIRQNSADIRALQGDVRQNSADIRALQRDVLQNSADIRALQGDVLQNSADIRALQGDVRQNSADIRALQGDVRNLDKKVDNLSGLEVRVAELERQRG